MPWKHFEKLGAGKRSRRSLLPKQRERQLDNKRVGRGSRTQLSLWRMHRSYRATGQAAATFPLTDVGRKAHSMLIAVEAALLALYHLTHTSLMHRIRLQSIRTTKLV